MNQKDMANVDVVGSVSSFVESCSYLVDVTEEFSNKIKDVVDAVVTMVISLQKEKIKDDSDINSALKSVRLVAHHAFAFVDKVNDIFYCGKETKDATDALSNRGDTDPFTELLDSLTKCMEKTKQEFITVKEYFVSARQSCARAAETAKDKMKGKKIAKIVSGVVRCAFGIAAIVLTAGLATPLVAGVAVAGVGVASAGAVGVAASSGGALVSLKVETFDDIAKTFDSVWLTGLNFVDEIKNIVSVIKESIINKVEYQKKHPIEAIYNALLYLNTKFTEYHGKTAPCKKMLKDKNEEMDKCLEAYLGVAMVTPNSVVSDDADDGVQKLIDKAMESGILPQRNVVGVITGLMGSGKTTLLCHLFGLAPPDLYTSTGVAERSFRGLLHHIVQRLSAGAWKRISYQNIREFLAPLIRAGMKEENVDELATKIIRTISEPEKGDVQENEEVSRDSPPPPLPAPQPGMSLASQKLAPLVKEASEESPPEDLILELVHMIDTGGQPELMEVMPTLIHNANLAMVLVDLRYGLDEHPLVHYHEEGVSYNRLQLLQHPHALNPATQQSRSPYTGKDIIMKLVSTLHFKKSTKKAFRLLIVATHRDCVEQSQRQTKVEALNRELQSLLLPEYQNELIFSESSKQKKIIPFVLNLETPEDSDKKALELIRTEIGKHSLGDPFDTPASFFVFEQDLIKFADSKRRAILTFNECRDVGEQLKMSSEMVVAALVLFHRQNIFLYFKKVLPNHVFVDPQVPIELVNDIVRFSYKHFECVPAKQVNLLERGIITEDLLKCAEISSHFKKDIYEVKDAIKLFYHTFTLAPLETDTAEREYLMMCLLPAIPDEELNDYIPESSDTVPLVVKFSSGCVPLGCFGSTISCLLSKYGWDVARKEYSTPKCLAHNIAALHDPDLLLDIVLVDHSQYIEIHISDLSIPPADACNEVCTAVFGAIKEVFDIMQLNIKLSPAVACTCKNIRGEHFAEFKKVRDKCLLHCSKTEPDEKQRLWVGSATANSRPTLPQLIQLRIPEKTAAKYFKFGTILLNDDNGSTVDGIKVTCCQDTENTVLKILQKWVREVPTPVTWENLIGTLREIELNALADYVQKTHKQQDF